MIIGISTIVNPSSVGNVFPTGSSFVTDRGDASRESEDARVARVPLNPLMILAAGKGGMWLALVVNVATELGLMISWVYL